MFMMAYTIQTAIVVQGCRNKLTVNLLLVALEQLQLSFKVIIHVPAIEEQSSLKLFAIP